LKLREEEIDEQAEGRALARKEPLFGAFAILKDALENVTIANAALGHSG